MISCMRIVDLCLGGGYFLARVGHVHFYLGKNVLYVLHHSSNLVSNKNLMGITKFYLDLCYLQAFDNVYSSTLTITCKTVPF